MSEFRADLHCHTTCSDGTASPEEVVRLAKATGLSGLSITDHDTVAAYAVAEPLCAELKIELLTGVEFSASQDGVSVHILGYGFRPDDPYIAALCSKHAERRAHRQKAILELLKQHDMPVSEEEIQASLPDQGVSQRSIGRPHIAEVMVRKGYVASIPDAFKRFLGDGKPCCAPGEAFSVQETMTTIHQAKGVAVLAHPHLLKNDKVLLKLLKMDFDGIECYYGCLPSQRHQRWIKTAKHKNWLLTGGSDFHGAVKPRQPLGSSWIGAEEFQAIKERIQFRLENDKELPLY